MVNGVSGKLMHCGDYNFAIRRGIWRRSKMASLILHHEVYIYKKNESRSIFEGYFVVRFRSTNFDLIVYNSRVTRCDPRIRVLS